MNIYFLLFYLFLSACNYATDNTCSLIKAAKKGEITQIETLLNAGLSIDSLYKEQCVLSAAVANHQKEAAHFLIDKKALVNVQCKPNKYHRPVWILTTAVESEQVEIIEHLLSAGADIECCAKQVLWTPLHLAINTSNSTIIDLLLAWGANTRAIDSHMKTPLAALTWLIEFHPIDNEEIRAEQNIIIDSLTKHMALQQEALAPTRSFFETAIAKGYFGLAKKAIHNGMKPLLSDLKLAKQQYLLLKQVGMEIPADTPNPFTLRDKKISTRAFRQIGKLFIQYLRFIGFVGCVTYPPISKNGIFLQLYFPEEVILHIAQYVIV